MSPTAAAARRPVGHHPVMGHHNHSITVESATNAYAAPSPPAQRRSSPANGTTLRDVIGTAVVAGCNPHRNTNITASSSGGVGNCTGATGAVAMHNGTVASDYYYYYSFDNVTMTAMFFPFNGTAAGGPATPFEKSNNCQWIPAQQSLFQFSNICFLTAFIVPRSYKLSVLSLR